jgi:hypothetical protein
MGRTSLRTFVVVTSALLIAAIRTGNAETPDHLKCFGVRDQRAQSNVRFDFTLTPQAGSPFPVEQHCTAKSRARSICIPVAKTSISPTPFPAPGGTPAGFTVCYAAKCPKETDVTFGVTDQIGGTGPLLAKERSQQRDLCVPAVTGSPTTTLPPVCGNDVIEPGEICDGTNAGACASDGLECLACQSCCAADGGQCKFSDGIEIPCCHSSCTILSANSGVWGPARPARPSPCAARRPSAAAPWDTAAFRSASRAPPTPIAVSACATPRPAAAAPEGGQTRSSTPRVAAPVARAIARA